MFTLKFASRILIVATVALSLGIASSAHAIDSFFDVFVTAMESGQLRYDSSPGLTQFDDSGTIIQTEILSMSLRSVGPVVVTGPSNPHYTTFSDLDFDFQFDPGDGIFQVDSFFEVATVLQISTATEALGLFDTEILSMDLSGARPDSNNPNDLLELRLDPNPDPNPDPLLDRASFGHITVLKLADNTYQVDSFFDVFTELSVDGGTTWLPSIGSTHLAALTNVVPEPSALTLLVVAGMALAVLRVRRAKGGAG